MLFFKSVSLWFASNASFSSHVRWPLFLLNADIAFARTSQVVLVVKNPPCQCRRRKRLRFQFLGWEDLWRRAWQLTLVFLPGESHGQRSLAGYSPLGRKELDMAEATQQHAHMAFTICLVSKQKSHFREWPSMLFRTVCVVIAFVHSLSWSFSHSATIFVYLTYSRHCGRCWRCREEQKAWCPCRGEPDFTGTKIFIWRALFSEKNIKLYMQ